MIKIELLEPTLAVASGELEDGQPGRLLIFKDEPSGIAVTVLLAGEALDVLRRALSPVLTTAPVTDMEIVRAAQQAEREARGRR